MSAVERTYSTPEGDYRLAEGAACTRIKVRCACGTFARNLRGVDEGIAWLRSHCSPPPGLVVQSFWCHVCKETVAITARMLGIAA